MAEESIIIDSTEIEKRLKQLKKVNNGTVRALNMALNKTATGMRTVAGQEAAHIYHMKKSEVIGTGANPIVKTAKSNYSSLSAGYLYKRPPNPACQVPA